MLEIDVWPEVEDPVLVVAITGWVDAGSAGELAASTLVSNLDDGSSFGRYALDDLVDLQQTRPTVVLSDGTTRHITWPHLWLDAGTAGRDVVVVRGPEPSLRWPSVSRDLVDLASRLGVVRAFTLGGMPAVVSHRRPVPVLATATARSLAQEVGATRTDYDGPTGMQTVLQVELGAAGIPTVGLWAQVPHYVSGNPSPPAVRAMLDRLTELGGIDVSSEELDEEIESYAGKVEEGLADRPDVADLVAAIESQTVEEVSGDALAAEIERFLREQ
ncbi:MAG TPA: PAC2 family protein [Acidimicrobiia bacterium]|nr:PAC2 family protein [Acidimicrobiia bacterium]